jgi:hypothetical protein
LLLFFCLAYWRIFLSYVGLKLLRVIAPFLSSVVMERQDKKSSTLLVVVGLLHGEAQKYLVSDGAFPTAAAARGGGGG